ncbi:uncharacterized protein MELLADRAFT_78109 [Melampsora larici-populina 98AG31]|uniref:Uncharacterized protein n=1 Tax=Melampsora larici-populina (strain 98AG31 / pathotype 3-4-7) TaxID=747676 RepID=F4RQ85_MELLP|nr:uncharacterized protein MELLADRAFT_78109 [Melampsora larici-populina 98AG31]EGG05448.1 hypothetical protein MELLADRAFT_78109 [Melampsora larici-populina 98AG31]
MSDNLLQRITTSVSAAAELNKHAERLRSVRMEEVEAVSQRRKHRHSQVVQQNACIRSIPHSVTMPNLPKSSGDLCANLPANPTTWSPSELAMYLSHVLNLGPARLIADIRAYVIGAGMGGRKFLQMTRQEFQDSGLNQNWVKMMSEARNRLRRECRRNRSETHDQVDWEDDEKGSPDPLQGESPHTTASRIQNQNHPSKFISAGQVRGITKYFEDEDPKIRLTPAPFQGGVVDDSDQSFLVKTYRSYRPYDPSSPLATKTAPALPPSRDAISRLSRTCSRTSSIDSFGSVLSTDEIDITSIPQIPPALICNTLVEAEKSVEWNEGTTLFRSPSPLGNLHRMSDSPPTSSNNLALHQNKYECSNLQARTLNLSIKSGRSALKDLHIPIPTLPLPDGKEVSGLLSSIVGQADATLPLNTVSPIASTSIINSSRALSLQNCTCNASSSYSNPQTLGESDVCDNSNLDDGRDECFLIKELLAHTEEILSTPQKKPRLEPLGLPSGFHSDHHSRDTILVSASKLKAMERSMFEIEDRLKRSKSKEILMNSREVSGTSVRSDRMADDPTSWSELGGYIVMATLGLGIVAGRVLASKTLGWKKS